MPIPRYILNNLGVSVPFHKRVNLGRKLVWLIHIPETDFVVVTAAEKQSWLFRIPVKTVPFLRMTQKTEFRLNLVSSWRTWVFVIVEKMNFTTLSLSCNHFRHLRHKPGFVYFALMVDLDLHLDSVFLFLAHHLSLRIGGVVVKAGIEFSGVFGGF